MEELLEELKLLISTVSETGIVTHEINNHIKKIKNQIDKQLIINLSQTEKRTLHEWRFLIDSLEAECS